MRIIGFNLSKIAIERGEKLDGKLEIKQNINIDSISKEKIEITKECHWTVVSREREMNKCEIHRRKIRRKRD